MAGPVTSPSVFLEGNGLASFLLSPFSTPQSGQQKDKFNFCYHLILYRCVITGISITK